MLMKFLLAILFCISLLFSCTQQEKENTQLENKIRQLQTQLDNTYKPGFGEFMSGIQVHHSKLWFAGTNANWKLADFEMVEIKEALNDIQKYNADRSESQSIPMLFGAMDSVNAAIKNQNTEQFKSSFVLLTNTCNSCHQATNHSFNVIKIPETPPFNNQNFKPVNEN